MSSGAASETGLARPPTSSGVPPARTATIGLPLAIASRCGQRARIVHRGQGEDIRRGEDVANVAPLAGEDDLAVEPGVGHLALQLVGVASVAGPIATDQHQPRRRTQCSDAGERLDQGRLSLPGGELRDRDHERVGRREAELPPHRGTVDARRAPAAQIDPVQDREDLLRR